MSKLELIVATALSEYCRRISFSLYSGAGKFVCASLIVLMISGCLRNTFESAEKASVLPYAEVIRKAERLAAQPFRDNAEEHVPKFLSQLSYDQWNDIQFKPANALWAHDGLFFTVRFFHPGYLYDRIVKINVVDDKGIKELHFSANAFDYGRNKFKDKITDNLGFAGFRLYYPLNKPGNKDETAVFLGASYFRAVAKNQVYGLSARGLAIDTASPNGEEFPFFKEFWLVKPDQGEQTIRIMALLDSKSVTGAYQFFIRPGQESIFRVNVVLFFRRKVEKLGIAPLTSMFLYGEHSFRNTSNDFRPEIHDSDGLYFETGIREQYWRPLVNPQRLFINSFQVNGACKYFAFLQRDRNFDHYQDLETHLEKRPSLIVMPEKPWPPGHIKLIQIPSNTEVQDNMVAFWSPHQLPSAGGRMNVSYTLKWGVPPNSDETSLGYVEATRRMKMPSGDGLKFVLDFQGESLKSIPETNDITATINVGKGYRLHPWQVEKNEVTGGIRLTFILEPEKGFLPTLRSDIPAVELRAFLNKNGKRITEIWSYAIVP